MPLQPLTETDLDLILPWRNAPAVRRNMYSHHEIAPAEHRAWFQRLQQDPGARWYLYRDAVDNPQGVVYFTAINPEQGTASWGFYARPDAPPGTGTRILYEALALAFGELSLHKLNGEVLATNVTSVNLHKKVGFTQEGLFRDQHFDGTQYIDVVRLGLLVAEWDQHRDRLRERVAQMDALAAQRPPPRKILILSDADSWINSYVTDLVEDWEAQGHEVHWAHDATDTKNPTPQQPITDNQYPTTTNQSPRSDFCFCLSYGRIVSAETRARFRHTLVVHESDLPRGKGWSPLTWQILEGQHRIPVTLFEAAERVDSGAIYAQCWLDFQGHELIDELRAAQAEATLNLCRWFVDDYPSSAEQARPQSGEQTFYPRRRPQDSRLDPKQTIAEQFNLLRVVDNERYPAFFEHHGRRYRIRVERH